MLAFNVFYFSCPNGQCGQLGGYFSGLLILNTATMQVTSLQTPAAYSSSWSPDGSKIALAIFGAGTFGRGALATVTPDGSNFKYVAMSFGNYSVQEVAWSPDAKRLALALNNENACPWYCDTALGVVNADGSDLKVLDKAHTCFLDSSCRANEAYIWGAPEWVGTVIVSPTPLQQENAT
jgi:Periplasmic component of the Tol biopolymer transport system